MKFISSLIISFFLFLNTCFAAGELNTGISYLVNNGGLNTKSSNFALKDNESSNCQNIYFGEEGGIKKRSGYSKWNSSAITSTPQVTGIYQYVQNDGTDYGVVTAGAKVYKTDDLGTVTLEDITGAVTVTAGYLFDFDTLNNLLVMTNGYDVPIKWTGTGNVAAADVPTDLTKAKWVANFRNYMFYGNCVVDGTSRSSRIYWSAIKDPTTWSATSCIDINVEDGEEITGMEVLGDRLVIFKESGIFNVLYTGDSDYPFISQKASSTDGCISGYTIKPLGNGLIYLGYDGVYMFDGSNSSCMSTKVKTKITNDTATTYLNKAVAEVYSKENQYWVSLTPSGGTQNTRVLIWDYFNDAWSWYVGISASAIGSISVGYEERLLTGNYAGYVFRQDNGLTDDGTAIEAYYWTKWFDFGAPNFDKKIMHVTVYLEDSGDYNVDVGYNYNFQSGVWKTHEVSLNGGGSIVGSSVTGTAVAGGEGGIIKRLDTSGAGKVFRMRFYNNGTTETFNIRGFIIQGQVVSVR